MDKILLYHGSNTEVMFPEIRKTKYTKDFSWGFYCTNNYEQAYKWADRKSKKGIVNVYSYISKDELKVLKFDKMTDEWLDFIGKCRAGYVHDYDIVEGPMADDTISRKVFWDYAEFKHPTHQISFHSLKALDCLKFERSEQVNE